MEMEEDDNDCLLKDLVCFIKDKVEKYIDMNAYIVEVDLLKKFPPHSVILPEANISPRVIIEHMKNRHEHIKYMIEEELVPLEYYLYMYKHDERIDCYKFTNNMSLVHDIITICYLYLLTVAIDLKDNELKLIENLSQIMTNKYQIQLDNIMLTHQNAITTVGITYSFPSISYPMYHFLISKHDYRYRNIFNFSKLFTATFLSFYTKRYFWLCFMLSSIIPRLNRDAHLPLGYLISLRVKLDEFLSLANPNYIRRSLKEIYEYITRPYYSEAFPMSLKLMICEEWNIVREKDNSYASLFKNYRYEAIRKIFMCYSNDPNLKSILSEI